RRVPHGEAQRARLGGAGRHIAQRALAIADAVAAGLRDGPAELLSRGAAPRQPEEGERQDRPAQPHSKVNAGTASKVTAIESWVHLPAASRPRSAESEIAPPKSASKSAPNWAAERTMPRS